ncbi:hypothetical protein [Leptospira ilyithenensis]|nr:hypothetical protein [Leptospira ilyithenensis]
MKELIDTSSLRNFLLSHSIIFTQTTTYPTVLELPYTTHMLSLY